MYELPNTAIKLGAEETFQLLALFGPQLAVRGDVLHHAYGEGFRFRYLTEPNRLRIHIYSRTNQQAWGPDSLCISIPVQRSAFRVNEALVSLSSNVQVRVLIHPVTQETYIEFLHIAPHECKRVQLAFLPTTLIA